MATRTNSSAPIRGRRERAERILAGYYGSRDVADHLLSLFRDRGFELLTDEAVELLVESAWQQDRDRQRRNQANRRIAADRHAV